MHPCPARRCRDIDGNAIIIADEKAMCEFHIGKVAQALGEMPAMYSGLGESKTYALATDDVNITASAFGAPVPIDLTARALQEDMLAVVRRAEHLYRRHTGWMSVGRRGRELPTLTGRCAFIAAHLEPVLAVDVTVGLDVLDLKFKIRRHLGLTRHMTRVPAPCPECDSMALRRDNGGSWVRCLACGLSFGEDAYGVLVKVLLEVNPHVPAQRTPKAQRHRCDAVGPRTSLSCRMHAEHRCSHLARSDNAETWETWR